MTDDENKAEFGYQAMQTVAKVILGEESDSTAHLLHNLKVAYQSNDPEVMKMLRDLGQGLVAVGRKTGAIE